MTTAPLEPLEDPDIAPTPDPEPMPDPVAPGEDPEPPTTEPDVLPG
jgi:hypothetical protein